MRDEGVAAQRDEQIFADLYPSLRRFAAVVRPIEEDADDLVQEALARALARRSLSDLDDPYAYLRRTIVHLASNHRRRLGRQWRAYARTAADGEHNTTYPSDLNDLRRLGPRDRAVLYLSLVEGYSYGEIAETLGGTAQAVRARASRALRRLRVDLEAEISDA